MSLILAAMKQKSKMFLRLSGLFVQQQLAAVAYVASAVDAEGGSVI